jgi:hypothetical protein
MPVFQNTLSVPSSLAYEDGTVRSKMLAHKLQMRITQKKAYTIQYTAKFSGQEKLFFL